MIFASAKSVGGAFLYPVVSEFLTIFLKKGRILGKKFSVLLNEKESILLKNYMKENKIKSKAEAIRKCLKTAVNMESKYDMLKDMDSKLNRIIYRENIQKKLLEQFFANMVFRKNYDVKTDESLNKFYQDNNSYSNKIMD